MRPEQTTSNAFLLFIIGPIYPKTKIIWGKDQNSINIQAYLEFQQEVINIQMYNKNSERKQYTLGGRNTKKTEARFTRS